VNESIAISVLQHLPPGHLPEAYEHAKVALAKCAKVDECKSWADKAEALASYAKQANDNTLRRLADRIQGRAIRREGELLEEVVAAKTGPKPKNSGPAPAANSGRFAMGRAAGLSDRQTKTALRVAKIPEAEFEEAIESENPPTVTELAERGTKRKPLVDLGDRTPEQFQAATGLIGVVRRFREYIENEADLDLTIPGLSERELKAVITSSIFVSLWLDKLTERLDARASTPDDTR
jgi:hypothetical protein